VATAPHRPAGGDHAAETVLRTGIVEAARRPVRRSAAGFGFRA